MTKEGDVWLLQQKNRQRKIRVPGQSPERARQVKQKKEARPEKAVLLPEQNLRLPENLRQDGQKRKQAAQAAWPLGA